MLKLAKKLAKTGKYVAVACSGLVVDGGIYRHDFVAHAVLQGIDWDRPGPLVICAEANDAGTRSARASRAAGARVARLRRADVSRNCRNGDPFLLDGV